jgi:hypothetical protein
MKSPSVSWRDALAVLIALAAFAGVAGMFLAESHVVLPAQVVPIATTLSEYGANVLPNLQKYSLAFGAILVAISVSYILLGHEEEIATSVASQPDKKK